MIVQIPLRWGVHQDTDGEVFFAKKVGHGFRLVPFTLTRDVGGTLLTNLICLYKYVQDKDMEVREVRFPLHAKPIWALQQNFRGGYLLGARVQYTLYNQVSLLGRNGFEIMVPWE